MKILIRCWLLVITLFVLSGCDDSNDNTTRRVIYSDEQALVELKSTLSGSAKSRYEWQQISGEKIALSGDDSPNITFTAPTSATELTLVFELTQFGSATTVHKEVITVIVVPYITGLVVDDPLIGATVRLLSMDGLNEHARTTTDENGRYRFSNRKDLSEYKVMVEANTGSMPNSAMFEAEMQNICINSSERHDCNITPISTLIVHYLDQTADINTKAEALSQVELALNVDLSSDPFVHEPPVSDSGSTLKIEGIRTYLDNGKEMTTWLDSMSTNITQTNNNEVLTPEEQTQLEEWVEFDRKAGLTLNAGSPVSKTVNDLTFTQMPTGGNGGQISYDSSNTDVATVDSDGLVTIVGAGASTITVSEAKTLKYLAQSDSYTLTVNRLVGQALNAGADLNKTIDDGSFAQAATGGNGGIVSYSSSNSSVATVDNTGMITIVGAGLVTITAFEAQGNNYLAQSDAYVLTVARGHGMALNMGLDLNKIATVDLVFTQAANGGNRGQISYESSDTDIAKVDSDGKVTVIRSGNATITATEAQSANYLAQRDSYLLTVARVSQRVESVTSTDSAFAALHSDGFVTVWGNSTKGGDNAALSLTLKDKKYITSIYSSNNEFAALHSDGSVTVWGQSTSMSSSVSENLNGSKPVVAIYSNESSSGGASFAALHSDGSVTTWGRNDFGGDSSSVRSALDGTNDVVSIFSTDYAFAALHFDGSVTTWGYSAYGGDSNSVSAKLDGTQKVISISSGRHAFAALHSDGSVTTWGDSQFGGDSSSVSTVLDGSKDVVSIMSTDYAFAALHSDGSVTTWGASWGGGDSSQGSKLDSAKAVTSIQSTSTAFAALHSDGSVSSWGNNSGGNSDSVSASLNGINPVTSLFSNGGAFAALHSDGSVTTWGGSLDGGDSSNVNTLLNGSKPVVTIYSAGYAFSALHSDGSVTTWGKSDYGGDSSIVSAALDGTNPVTAIFSTQLPRTSSGGSFAALHLDGSVTAWGDVNSGGDSSAIGADIIGTTDRFYDNYDTDNDGITNIDELRSCSVPYSTALEDSGNKPCQSAGKPDSDGDGVWDNVEINNGTNPLKGTYLDSNADINSDSYPDSWILPATGLNTPSLTP